MDDKPFHEAIVGIIDESFVEHFDCLAGIIRVTKIPANHDAIISAWQARVKKLDLDDLWDVVAVIEEKKPDIIPKLYLGEVSSLLKEPVEVLDLSTRAFNCLYKPKYVFQILIMLDEIPLIRNFGKKTRDEISSKLKNYLGDNYLTIAKSLQEYDREILNLTITDVRKAYREDFCLELTNRLQSSYYCLGEIIDWTFNAISSEEKQVVMTYINDTMRKNLL